MKIFLAFYTNMAFPIIIHTNTWEEALDIAIFNENPIYQLQHLNAGWFK
jgi:hypothetical protein